MRAIRAASAALLSAAALGLAVAPSALADGNEGYAGNEGNVTSFGFAVTPVTVVAGGTVTLTSDGCSVPSVTVSSGVFESVTLVEGRSGTATVDVDAVAGARHEITFDCKGERGTAVLTIAGPPAKQGAHKGVKAGYGSQAAASDEGLGATQLVTGVLLIAGALGAAVVLTRRRAAGGS
ncbi:hypothetical protein AB0G79_15555 [Streptomyces sp. NPDC020807]|uniref:hypothetical protein n=1 Tax=Streptomyces sp. NPDC020807 TaxID=3155119 RepID=UPI0033F09F09